MKAEKVIRDGKVAVLYSPGFGAGWSSWAGEEHKSFALFDHRLVAAVEGGASVSDIEELVQDILGEDFFCCLGARTLQIEWLPVGTAFRIAEYDGSEWIVVGRPDEVIA